MSPSRSPARASSRRACGSERLRRGALGLETSEPEFEFDADGHVVRAIDAVQTESHNLIEELMILANEQVAQELSQRRIPTLYRVHEQPEPTAIEFLVAQLESLDVPTPPLPDSHHAREPPASSSGRSAPRSGSTSAASGHGRAALTSLVLRSLKQAYLLALERRARRPRERRLHALHVADPPLPRPGRPPGAAGSDRRGRAAASRSRAERDRLALLADRA